MVCFQERQLAHKKYRKSQFQHTFHLILCQQSHKKLACYKSINIKSRHLSKSMSHSDCTVNSVPIIQQHADIMQNGNWFLNDDISIEVPLPRHQPEQMDVEDPSSESHLKEDSEYHCKHHYKRIVKKARKIKNGNSSDLSPKVTNLKSKKNDEAEKLHLRNAGGVDFLIQDEYIKACLANLDGDFECLSQLPLSIRQDLISRKKDLQLTLSPLKDSNSPNYSHSQVLIRYQTLAFKSNNLKAYCWSLAPVQNEEIFSNRLRARNPQKADVSGMLMHEQLNMTPDDVTIYFNKAKYRFNFSEIWKAIEEMAEDEKLSMRDKQDQLVYYKQKKVQVLPRLLKKESQEFVNFVQTKRMMIRKRKYSQVRS